MNGSSLFDVWESGQRLLEPLDRNFAKFLIFVIVVVYAQTVFFSEFGWLDSAYSVAIGVGLYLLGPFFFLPAFKLSLRLLNKIGQDFGFLEPILFQLFAWISLVAAFLLLATHPWAGDQIHIGGLPPVSFAPASLGMYWASRKVVTWLQGAKEGT